MLEDEMRSADDPVFRTRAYEEIIRENISYDDLLIAHPDDRDLIEGIKDLKFDPDTMTDTLPAYLCIIAMPLFYSISEGISIGCISYVVINLLCGKAKKITPLMYVLAVLFVCKYIFL